MRDRDVKRRVLFVAYHFPPIQGSSGVHRTLSFAKYLADFGWDASVLTARVGAYDSFRNENLALIPRHVDVSRAFAWNTARDFSIRGRYPGWLALPDNWQSWIPFAVAAGLAIIRKQRPDVIFSTFPIASAHVIGSLLHRLTKVPWVTDFRDPMVMDHHPTDPTIRKIHSRVEKNAIEESNKIIVTTSSTAEYYAAQYPQVAATKIRVIQNGFDPEAFPAFAGTENVVTSDANRKIVLLHSGIIYPTDRDPEPFLTALARLKSEGLVDRTNLEVRFRAPGYEDRYQQMIDRLAVGDLVGIHAPLPYEDALREMQQVDSLLIFQAASCNRQIPAKAYEYLYAGKPILGVTDPVGDTGRLLKDMGVESIAALENIDAITSMLKASLARLRDGTLRACPREEVMKLSRRARAAELSQVLNELISG